MLAKEDSQGNKRLVGYIVPEDDFDKAAIERYLENKLPEYMIPQVWVELESLPLTANGKVDRKALPEPEAQAKAGGYEAPQTETEEKLVEIWQEILEVDQVGINDDFFELGGHSLLAIRLISMIRKELGAEVKIGDVFDYPTIALLSGRITTEGEPQDLLPTIEIKTRPERIPLIIQPGALVVYRPAGRQRTISFTDSIKIKRKTGQRSLKPCVAADRKPP